MEKKVVTLSRVPVAKSGRARSERKYSLRQTSTVRLRSRGPKPPKRQSPRRSVPLGVPSSPMRTVPKSILQIGRRGTLLPSSDLVATISGSGTSTSSSTSTTLLVPGSILYEVDINPSTIAPNGYLETQSRSYTRYRFKSVRFHFQGSLSTMTDGLLVGFFDSDIELSDEKLSPSALLAKAYTSPTVKTCKVWEGNRYCCWELKDTDPYTTLFVDPAATNSPALWKQSKFYLLQGGSLPLKDIGSLTVETETNYFIPRLKTAVVPAGWDKITYAVVDAKTPFLSSHVLESYSPPGNPFHVVSTSDGTGFRVIFNSRSAGSGSRKVNGYPSGKYMLIQHISVLQNFASTVNWKLMTDAGLTSSNVLEYYSKNATYTEGTDQAWYNHVFMWSIDIDSTHPRDNDADTKYYFQTTPEGNNPDLIDVFSYLLPRGSYGDVAEEKFRSDGGQRSRYLRQLAMVDRKESKGKESEERKERKEEKRESQKDLPRLSLPLSRRRPVEPDSPELVVVSAVVADPAARK